MIPEIDFDPETNIHKHLEVKGSGQGGYQKIKGGIHIYILHDSCVTNVCTS